ncbi:Panacea domain-containing protein [Gemella bergeri]
MNTIKDVAKWFLSKESMTHKKLQKLCYYYVAWSYALYSKVDLVNPEFEAWVHGPVSPSIYSSYFTYRWNFIPQYEDKVSDFSDEETYLLESVWLTYGDKCGDELEALTHSEAPWIEARSGLGEYERSNVEISPKTMERYYQSVYEVNQGV